MQTQQEQAQANAARRAAYFAKLSETQRRRALVAERVSDYSKRVKLEIAQAWAAIRIATAQLEKGLGVAEACETGINAALTIARVSCNQRLPCIRQRWTDAGQQAS